MDKPISHNETSQIEVIHPNTDSTAKHYSGVYPYSAEDAPSFSYEGFQVTRGEYYAHIHEPTIVFADCKFNVNMACLKKAPDVDYVQILVNRDQGKLVVRPCHEDDRDSFPWCSLKRKTRQVTCKIFFYMIMDMMNWNPNYRYKVIGKMIRYQDEFLFVFDLMSAETYQRHKVLDEHGKEKRYTDRNALYPDTWKGQFGLPVEEHRKAIQISIFDGYVVYGLPNAAIKPLVEQSPQGSDQL